MKKLNLFLSICMLLFSYSANTQSINQALTATATQSGGGVTIYGPQNYNDGIITATPAQTPWGWVLTNGWIEYTWTAPVSINAVALYKADRPMTTCTFQYWDGTSYVNFLTYNNTVIAYDSISFPTITTTRLRFDGVAGSGNPNHREIRAWLNISSPNDAAVASVDSPMIFCAGVENVIATVANYGSTPIDSVEVGWSVNGAVQTPIKYIGLLDTIGSANPWTAQVTLGTYNFPAGSTNISVWTFNPNGMADTTTVNDTANATVVTASPPAAATVLSAGLTNANATVGNANGIDYVVVPFGAPPTSGTPVANVNSPFSISGLASSTTYDLYVRKNCGAGNVSAWVGPTTFNTAYAVPFLQDFENFPSGLQGNSFPEGWSQRLGTGGYNMWRSQQASNGNNLNSFGTGPLWDHTYFGGPTNGVYMYMETSTSNTGDTVELYSPPIYIDSVLTTVELGYWYFNHGLNIDKMEVLVDSNGVKNLLATYTGQTQPTQTDPWLFASHFLNGYNGKSVTLVFRGYGVPCCSGDIAVDDITLDPVLALDAGVTDVISPSGSLCPGNVTPIIEVRNYGSTQLDSVKVFWDINGTLDSMTYVGTIAPGTRVNVSLPVLNIMAGTVYNIDFYTGDVNGQADQFPGNNNLALPGLRTGLNGTVTVNPALPASGTNFVDFASLTATLNNYGVCGTAVVNVANGTYNSPIVLDNVPGLDASNTLLIDGGDSSMTIVTHDGSTNFATLTMTGVDYVTVRNMTIENTAALNGAAVLMSGGTDHNTIGNCIVRMNTSTTSFNSAAISISGSSTSATQTPSAHARHNTFENNVIRGGYYGVRIYGDFNSVNGVYNRVLNNDIDSSYYYGAYIYYQDSAEVVNNRIQMMSRGNVQADGLYMYANNNGKINYNYIWSPDWTLYWSNTNTTIGTLTRRNEVINNMVYSSTDYGAYMYAVDSMDFWYNSINTEASGVPALYLTTFGTYFMDDWDLRNNVLQSAGSAALDLNQMTDTIFSKMDNNVYNTVNGGVLIDINGTTYATLAAYQTAQPLLNSSSLEGDPQFASATDLHIIGAFINDSADASVPVMTDIDGETRPKTGAAGPDPGADEYDPPTCPPASNLRAYDPGLDSATIAWSTTLTGVSFEYVVVLGGAPMSSGTPVGTVADTARLGGLTASTRYDFYVRIVCGRGDTSQWMGPRGFNTANGIPYFQDFETWGNPNFTGLINEEGWYTLGTPVPNWQVNSATGSFATGPVEDHTIGVGGTFVYLETSGGTAGNTDTLWSAPIYFSPSQNAVTLEYWYHMHGAAMGTLEVYTLANGVLSAVHSTFTGQQHIGQTDPWLSATANIGGYGGQSIQLVFVGIRGTSFTSDMAIDDVRLFIPPPIDGGVTEILSPASGCGLGVDSVEIEITNFGTGSLSNFPVQYSLNGGAPVVETFTGTIASGATATHTFSTTVNLSTAGSYTIASQTNIANDGDVTNDADTANIESIPLVGSPAVTLYVEDFEGGIGGWVPSGTLWQWGVPTGTVIGTAGSGTNSYVTNLAGNYPNNATAYLQGPCFDFTGAANPAIEFQINWDTEISWDGGLLESSIDGGQTWQKVGDIGTGNNWYSGNVNAIGGSGWVGNSGGWIVASHGLDSLVGQSSVLLRFGFLSDGSVNGFDGMGVDSIMVYNNINVGIEDQASNVPSFSLSPNPSNGEFMLKINSEKSDLFQLSIRDMEGKLVHNEQLNVNGNFNKSMDLSHLAKGVYFMRLQNDDESKVEKLIIQ